MTDEAEATAMGAATTGTTAKGTATPRIVIVGAGGWVFPVELTRDILSFPALSGGTLVLYDIDIDAAAKTAKAAEQLIELGGLTAQVEIPADLPTALRGADFVLTVFQVGGVRAYAHDLLIPREYGIDQIVGDTLGPGGVFRGLRTIEALRVVAQTMLAECPGALLLNYTNPMAPNIWATDLLGVKVIGLCHSVQNTAELLARELGVPLEEVTFDSAGVNHTAWFTTFRRGADDLIPRIRSVMRARYIDETEPLLPRSDDPYESIERVRAELMELTGFFHTESSHHASEYWAWFRKSPELTAHYLDRHWDNLEISSTVDKEQTDQEFVDEARRDGILHGGEFAAPIMDSVVTGTPRIVYVNVRNDGLITNLPPDACVEVACVADRSGVRPTRYGALPPACAALNEVQIAVQRLIVRAAMTGSRELVHAAVALDPLTSAMSTLPKIREMTDKMLAAEAEWLPQFEPSAQRNAGDGYLAGTQR
jgi:alpha-galactosidase